MKIASAGIALGDLTGDGNLDIIAGGNITGDVRDGYGLFWFRRDEKGGWSLVQDSGLPTRGLPVIHSVTVADLEGHGALEIVAVSGTPNGSITIWKRGKPCITLSALKSRQAPSRLLPSFVVLCHPSLQRTEILKYISRLVGGAIRQTAIPGLLRHSTQKPANQYAEPEYHAHGI